MRDPVSHPSSLTASSAVLKGREEGGARGRDRGREGVIGSTVVVVVVLEVEEEVGIGVEGGVETVSADEWRNSNSSHSLLIS
jgi:hypothetical protein